MPLDFNLYLSSDELHSSIQFCSMPDFRCPYDVRGESRENGHVISGSIRNRKWSADDNVAQRLLESTARFSLEQRYNAEATLRNNLSSSNLCVSDSNSNILNQNNSSALKKKRQVRFADSQGLPLVSVCFFDTRCIFERALTSNSEQEETKNKNNNPELSLCFEQPVSNYAQFWEQLEGNKIALENIMVCGKFVRGTVKVKNLAFEKQVRVRCSHDQWESHTDVPTTYLSSCYYSNSDTFTFEFMVPPVATVLEIALQYVVGDREFWDNNGGLNYKLQQ